MRPVFFVQVPTLGPLFLGGVDFDIMLPNGRIKPGTMSGNRESSHSQTNWKRLPTYGFILGAGVALIGLIVWFSVKGTPPSPPAVTEGKPAEVQVQNRKTQPDKGLPAAPPAVAKVPTESAAPLESQLAQVLAGIREANQKKDLPLLLSHYSPNFPQLQQRVQYISKTWKVYDYPKMDFKITEVKLLTNQTAQARVTWNVKAQNITTRKNKTILKTYVIRFSRESSQWRVKSLQPGE
jgi:hypothetical protein